MAQVALLQTEINSGLRFCPKIGKKSPTIRIKGVLLNNSSMQKTLGN